MIITLVLFKNLQTNEHQTGGNELSSIFNLLLFILLTNVWQYLEAMLHAVNRILYFIYCGIEVKLSLYCRILLSP